MLTILEQARREEYEYCRSHLVYFIEEYVKIEGKEDAPIIPFTLWPKQKEALNSIAEHKLNIILKARQLGITWLVLAFALHMLISKEGAQIVALSRTETEAKELIRRMNTMISHLGAFVHPHTKEEGWSFFIYKSNSTEITLYKGGSVFSHFKVFASAAGAARSFTADLIIFDEWAYQQCAEDIWISGLPTVNRPNGGKVIGLSTMQLGTLFEKLWRKNRLFNRIFLPWNTDPRRTDKWYDETRELLGELVYQEYPKTAAEALLSPGGCFFNELKREIHVCTPFEIPSHWAKYHAIDYGLDMLAGVWAAFDDEGNAYVYREVYESDLIIADACAKMAELEKGEDIYIRYAPPDLFGRSNETGKTRIEAFSEHGFCFEKASADREAGWSVLKEWLKVTIDKDGKKSSRLKIFSCCENLIRTLFSIPRDKRRPSDCARHPHELTHAPDALRYLMVMSPCAARKEKPGESWVYEAENIINYGI